MIRTKRKPRKRKPKSPIARQRELNDALYQQLLMESRGRTSELSGEPAHCAHHIFTKASSLATRWDPENGILVTAAEHTNCHGSRFTEWLARIITAIGMRRFEHIRQRHRKKVKATLGNYRAIGRWLDEQVRHDQSPIRGMCFDWDRIIDEYGHEDKPKPEDPAQRGGQGVTD